MPKNIALFLDGTGNDQTIADAVTSVWLLFESAEETAGKQLKCYLPGVGAKSTRPICAHPPDWKGKARLKPDLGLLDGWVRKKLAGATGLGTSFNIKLAYAFLCEHYERTPGDRIFLFGFSRGALAARSLAGFLSTVGVLFASRLEYVELAYTLYVHRDPGVHRFLRKFVYRLTGVLLPPRPYRGLSSAWRSDQERDMDPLPEKWRMPAHFIGVWDTVSSTPYPGGKPKYHRTELPRWVSIARHALALHELRAWTFPPVLFNRCPEGGRVKQVWFNGAHADVGGGYAPNERGLSTIAIDWMAGEAQKHGLLLKTNREPQRDQDPLNARVHEEISARGTAWLDSPRVRRALAEPWTLPPAILDSFELHPSVLARLRGTPSIEYALPLGVRGQDVNAPLAEADDAALRLHLFLLLRAQEAKTVVLAGPPPRNKDMEAWPEQREELATGLTTDDVEVQVRQRRTAMSNRHTVASPPEGSGITILPDEWWKTATVGEYRASLSSVRHFLFGHGKPNAYELESTSRALALLLLVDGIGNNCAALFDVFDEAIEAYHRTGSSSGTEHPARTDIFLRINWGECLLKALAQTSPDHAHHARMTNASRYFQLQISLPPLTAVTAKISRLKI